MPLLVTPNIVHPRASAWTRWEPTAPYVNVGMSIVYQVSGLDSTFIGAPARALASSLAAYGIPVAGTLAPDPNVAKYGAIALDYDTEVIPQSTDSIYIIVGWRTPVARAQGGGPALFVISDDTVLVQEATSLHPDTKAPMKVMFTDPDDSNNSPTKIATFSYARPLRKLVVSGYVVDQDLDLIRSIVGAVCDQEWFGLDRGFWKFEEFRTEGTILSSMFKVTAGFTTRVNENWMEYEVFYNELLGQFVEVDQGLIDGLRKKPYSYGWASFNGITVAGLHPLADFNSAFGIG